MNKTLLGFETKPKKSGKTVAFYLLLVIGILLIISSVSSLLLFPMVQKENAKKAKETASSIKALLPSGQKGTFDNLVNSTMPSFEFSGENYVCLIEIPKFEASFPVYSRYEKNKLSKAPCRYSGSVYNRSLVIFGSENIGQFDFMKNISIGDYVFLTDMTGLEYSFSISDIVLTENIEASTLHSENASLILFSKETYGNVYTILYCK